MTKEYGQYFWDLSNKKLSIKPVEPVLAHMRKLMTLEEVHPSVLKKGEYGLKVTEQLTRLELSIVKGNRSWEGLVVVFPGDRHDLTTKNVSTPYLRMILYPMLDLCQRIQEDENRRTPCLDPVGDRFLCLVEGFSNRKCHTSPHNSHERSVQVFHQ